MKVFRKTDKAREKWRNAGRMINISKTRVVIIATDEQQPRKGQRLPPWLHEKLLIESQASLKETNQSPSKPSRIECPEDVHAKLMQQLGLEDSPA